MDDLPIDPTFPPKAYERHSNLLRTGVISFFILATAGLIGALIVNPGQTVGELVAFDPRSLYIPPSAFLSSLLALNPSAFILLGIYVMIALTIGRVALAAWDFRRGGERTLMWVSILVVALLLVGIFAGGQFAH